MLGLGLWLRFHALDWMEYAGDEYILVRDSIAVASGEWRDIGPQTSIGLPLPNFILYLLAIPAWLHPDPLTLVRFVGVLNVLGLAALARLLWCALSAQGVGWTATLVASAFLSTSPMLVLFSRKIWNPDLLFPFLAALLCVLGLLREQRTGVLWALAIPSCVLWTGFHHSALFLLPILIVWAACFVQRWSWRWVACGVALAVVLHAPYLLRLLESNFDDVRFVATMRERAPAPTLTRFESLSLHFVQLLKNSGAGELADTRPAMLVAQLWNIWMGVAIGAACLWSLGWIRKRAQLPLLESLVILAAWLCLGIVLALGWGRYTPEPHYYATVQPLPALLGMWLLWRWTPRAAALLVLPLAGLHAALLAGFLSALQAGAIDPRVPYATPYAPARAEWEARLAEETAEIRAGHPLARQARELARQRFEPSTTICWRWDASQGLEPLALFGRPRLEIESEWLQIEESSLVDMLQLPACTLEEGNCAALRLELSVPKPLLLTLMFPSSATADYRHGQKVDLWLQAGPQTLSALLPEAYRSGRVMLRVPASRYQLRHAEIRAVPCR
jgi:hypothetical protein